MTTTQPGDVWHVGNHRLAIGDASDRDLVTKLFQGSTPDLVVTSPPYNTSASMTTKSVTGMR